MTRKADFNAEEWSVVAQGPPMAGLRVMAAERGGTIRESVSMAQAYVDVRKEHGSSELVDDLVASRPEIDPAEVSSADELSRLAVSRLRDAVAVLERKAPPEELEAYRDFVMSLAQRVASSHREGGFLGVGGKQVSDSEQAALDEIGAALQPAAD